MSNVQKTTSLRQLVRMTLALFLTYLSVAMAMPAVSVHVSQTLGLGNVLSGLAVGIAFLSTILSRGWAGRLADERGGKVAMFRGLVLYAAATLLCWASSLPALGHGAASYSVLLMGRLLLGLGESFALVGMLSWAMSAMGPARSGQVMALVGAGMYGAFAAGGPLGLWLLQKLGFAGLMAASMLLPAAGALMLWSMHRPLQNQAFGNRSRACSASSGSLVWWSACRASVLQRWAPSSPCSSWRKAGRAQVTV